jgi:hypothetical protein
MSGGDGNNSGFEAHPPGEGEHDALCEYRKCIENISRKNPRLSIGAMQQMALKEQCAKMAEEQKIKDDAKRRTGIRGIISKLHIGGKKHRADDQKDELGSTIDSSATSSNDISLSHRRSVGNLSFVEMSDRSLRDISGTHFEENLEDSLEDIEKSFDGPGVKTRRRNSTTRSRRTSGLSLDLSDVNEDEEWNEATDEVASGAGLSKEERAKSENFQLSLPDEIRDVLAGFSGSEPGTSAHPESHQLDTKYRGSTSEMSQRSSLMASVMSCDSTNFQGDFSAWSSFTSPASK